MKKVLIVGTGGQGGSCASILARDKDVTEIVLGDIDIELANKVKNKIKSDKISAVKLNAGKIEEIKNTARDVDVIINLTLPQFNVNIMQAALESGVHYLDSASGEPLWTQLTKGQPLEFDDEFKKAHLAALIACGGSPGVTNVLARYACDKLDRVDEIRIRLGGKPLKESREVVSAWDPGWAPEVAISDFALPPGVFENGKPQVYPIFSGCEEYVFPDPVGPMLVTYHAHEESVTLPRFIGKGIKYCDFKYQLDPIAGALVKMGFAERRAIDVKGVKVTPIDVLMKLVHHPVDTFLSENESVAKLPPALVVMIVTEIKGAKAGEDIAYRLTWPYFLFTTVEEKLEMYQKFGTTNIAVALPAIIGAKMCVAGQAERGVIAPECLDANKFLKMMADAGAPVRFEEICSKEISVC
jgi:saccharopine dehydrogenase-like NADP-dependent oxidoreductase